MTIKEILEKQEKEFYDKFYFIQVIKNEKSGNAYTKIIDFIKSSNQELIKAIIDEIDEYEKELKEYPFYSDFVKGEFGAIEKIKSLLQQSLK